MDSRPSGLKEEDMIERVARAICRRRYAADGEPDPCDDVRQAFGGGFVPVWTLYAKDAHAAIGAMREPTEAMCKAAFAYYGNDPHPFRDEWIFMIDAALKSPSGV